MTSALQGESDGLSEKQMREAENSRENAESLCGEENASNECG